MNRDPNHETRWIHGVRVTGLAWVLEELAAAADASAQPGRVYFDGYWQAIGDAARSHYGTRVGESEARS